MMKIAIIVPVLNEAAGMPALLEHLQYWYEQGCEIIVVDGGSVDQTLNHLASTRFTVMTAEAGRARQMNAGAQAASAPWLLFLHADSQLPASALQCLQQHYQRGKTKWGFFKIRIIGQSMWLRLIGGLMNLRSQLTGIATGDQAIFVEKGLFEQLNGFPDQPLMEDIEICKRLGTIYRPYCLPGPVVTSGRRWEKQGIWRTVFLMWRLRFAYWRGVSVETLAQQYHAVR